MDAEELEEREARRGCAPRDDGGRDELPVGAAAQDQRRRTGKQRVLRELRRRDEMHERLGAHEDPEHERRRGDPERQGRTQQGEAGAQPLAERSERNHDDGQVGELEPEVGRAERHPHAGLVLDVQEEEGDGQGQRHRSGADARGCRRARPQRQGLRHGHGASLGKALPRMVDLMRSRLFWRRSAAAAGTYASAALGFLGTVVALHVFSTETFGRYALVMAATAFAQSLLDLTVEEALVKFGFRFTTREDWGRLRRLFESAIAFKLTGGVLATGLLLALAPAANSLLHKSGLTTALLIAAFLPLAQCTENVSGVALILRGRYDIRAFFLFVSMALRFTAIAVGAPHGLNADDRGDRRRTGRRDRVDQHRRLVRLPALPARRIGAARRRAA